MVSISRCIPLPSLRSWQRSFGKLLHRHEQLFQDPLALKMAASCGAVRHGDGAGPQGKAERPPPTYTVINACFRRASSSGTGFPSDGRSAAGTDATPKQVQVARLPHSTRTPTCRDCRQFAGRLVGLFEEVCSFTGMFLQSAAQRGGRDNILVFRENSRHMVPIHCFSGSGMDALREAQLELFGDNPIPAQDGPASSRAVPRDQPGLLLALLSAYMPSTSASVSGLPHRCSHPRLR